MDESDVDKQPPRRSRCDNPVHSRHFVSKLDPLFTSAVKKDSPDRIKKRVESLKLWSRDY